MPNHEKQNIKLYKLIDWLIESQFRQRGIAALKIWLDKEQAAEKACGDVVLSTSNTPELPFISFKDSIMIKW